MEMHDSLILHPMEYVYTTQIFYQVSQYLDLLSQGITNLSYYFSSLWSRNLRKEWNFMSDAMCKTTFTTVLAMKLQRNKIQSHQSRLF